MFTAKPAHTGSLPVFRNVWRGAMKIHAQYISCPRQTNWLNAFNFLSFSRFFLGVKCKVLWINERIVETFIDLKRVHSWEKGKSWNLIPPGFITNDNQITRHTLIQLSIVKIFCYIVAGNHWTNFRDSNENKMSVERNKFFLRASE